MVRDEEIQRLISYIKGIGLKVSFTSKDKDASALWYLDNSGIVICKKHNTTKIETVLSLLHELGHAMHNIHEKQRKVDPKIDKALDHLNNAEEFGTDTQKRHRKAILDNEIAGSQYWHAIYKETNMKFPIWKLESAMEFDLWQYQVFFETSSYPIKKERTRKRKEIAAKHRSRYEG